MKDPILTCLSERELRQTFLNLLQAPGTVMRAVWLRNLWPELCAPRSGRGWEASERVPSRGAAISGGSCPGGLPSRGAAVPGGSCPRGLPSRGAAVPGCCRPTAPAAPQHPSLPAPRVFNAARLIAAACSAPRHQPWRGFVAAEIPGWEMQVGCASAEQTPHTHPACWRRVMLWSRA